MNEPTYISDPFLSRPIEVTEISNAVLYVRNKDEKSTGVENLPAEVQKNETKVKALHKLFNLIFERNKIPSIWKKEILLPVLKEPNSHHRIPLYYMGISLLSVISKVYTQQTSKCSL